MLSLVASIERKLKIKYWKLLKLEIVAITISVTIV